MIQRKLTRGQSGRRMESSVVNAGWMAMDRSDGRFGLHAALAWPLLEAREFVEVTELTPLCHDKVVILVNRSAVRRVADAVLPLVLG